jgi:hypothetical protein
VLDTSQFHVELIRPALLKPQQTETEIMDPSQTKHGEFSWNELLTTDPAAATKFYTQLRQRPLLRGSSMAWRKEKRKSFLIQPHSCLRRAGAQGVAKALERRINAVVLEVAQIDLQETL